MSQFTLVRGDMTAAGDTVRSAATQARRADATAAVSMLAGGLPGSTTAEVLPQLATSWDDAIDGWAASVEGFADALDATSADATGTDTATSSAWSTMGAAVGSAGSAADVR